MRGTQSEAGRDRARCFSPSFVAAQLVIGVLVQPWRRRGDQRGQAMTEYALVSGIVSIAFVIAFWQPGIPAAIATFAGKVVTKLDSVTL